MGKIVKNFKEFNEINENLDEAVGKVSKKLLDAIDKHHEAQLNLQKLQKEFIKTPKEDIVKREKLKKQLIAANKIAKEIEAKFRHVLSQEETDDTEIIW